MWLIIFAPIQLARTQFCSLNPTAALAVSVEGSMEVLMNAVSLEWQQEDDSPRNLVAVEDMVLLCWDTSGLRVHENNNRLACLGRRKRYPKDLPISCTSVMQVYREFNTGNWYVCLLVCSR